MNKKILNATPTQSNGIAFKSSSEKTIYNALLKLGITPEYEGVTFTLSPVVRPTVVFYTRKSMKNTEFCLNSKPLDSITYTPDFTFHLNGYFVIVEVKGFPNDVYPVKRNMFRKLLETYKEPVMFFEVRTIKELLKAIDIVKKESKPISDLRSLIPNLPEKDIPSAFKALESRDFSELEHIVNLAIRRIEKKPEAYLDSDLNNLHILQAKITEITIHEELS